MARSGALPISGCTKQHWGRTTTLQSVQSVQSVQTGVVAVRLAGWPAGWIDHLETCLSGCFPADWQADWQTGGTRQDDEPARNVWVQIRDQLLIGRHTFHHRPPLWTTPGGPACPACQASRRMPESEMAEANHLGPFFGSTTGALGGGLRTDGSTPLSLQKKTDGWIIVNKPTKPTHTGGSLKPLSEETPARQQLYHLGSWRAEIGW